MGARTVVMGYIFMETWRRNPKEEDNMDVSTQGTQAGSSYQKRKLNLPEQERIFSVAVGTGSLLYGLRRGGVLGLAVGAAGAWLAYRGLSGEQAEPQHFSTSLTIDRSPEDLYQFWHGFTRLPQVLRYIDDIQTTGEGRTHWVAGTPGGGKIEWDSEVTEDVPNEQISWHTTEGSDIHHEGHVSFRQAPTGRGTEVELELRYEPLGGTLGTTVARYLNSMTEGAAREDLRRFKRLMEGGEIPTGSRTANASQGGIS